MIELFAQPMSAYCAKVIIILELKGLEYKVIAPQGGYSSKAYRETVPSGTIPAIRIGEFILHDSDAIANYLEDRYPEPSLRPENIEQRAKLNAFSNFHDTKLEPILRQTYSLVSQPRETRETAVKDLQVRLADSLSRLEGLISPAPFLGGGSISLADCGYPLTFAYIERIMTALGHPVVISEKCTMWRRALEENPVIKRIVNQHLMAFDDWLDAKLVR